MPNPNASAKFKKKAEAVEVVSVTLVLTGKPADYPQWVVDAFKTGDLRVEGATLMVNRSMAHGGDMLVKTNGGGIIPLKLDQFNALYEPA
jgi:hypothetical protein